MNLNLNLVWVEVGRPVPRYAMENFSLTRKLHSDIQQYLVTDSLKSFENQLVIKTSQLEKSQETKQFENIQKVWRHKQEYFWQGTTARFFYLHDAMLLFGLEGIVHLETDCVLLQTDAITTLIDTPWIELAYPLQARGIGCASILYIKNHEGLRKFLHYILENWTRTDVDDMVLLGEYSVNSGVKILPTKIEMHDSSQEFIFDAVSVGKYFMGTDARTSRLPFATRKKVDLRDGSATKLLENGFLRFNSNLSHQSIEVTVTDSRTKLANIHIHSKAISSSIFRMNLRLKIAFGIKLSLMWKIGRFDKIVFLERLASYWFRRVKREVNFEERNYR
jgi:hypothetical protein